MFPQTFALPIQTKLSSLLGREMFLISSSYLKSLQVRIPAASHNTVFGVSEEGGSRKRKLLCHLLEVWGL